MEHGKNSNFADQTSIFFKMMILCIFRTYYLWVVSTCALAGFGEVERREAATSWMKRAANLLVKLISDRRHL